MSPDLLRDSVVGQALNWASKGRILSHADQRPGYDASRYSITPPVALDIRSSTLTLVEPSTTAAKDLEKGDAQKAVPVVASPFLVDWEPNDPDNPRNWSTKKRNFVAFLIAAYTFSIYIGSAIYTSSIPSLMNDFHISGVVATLGLTLFVLFYGIGPMFFSPLQDMPRFGRNYVYIAGLFLFVIFQIPQIFAPNFATILVFRALSGFVGSPALAQGGASMGDIFPPQQMAYAIGTWSIGAVCGPVLGPVIGGFAAQHFGWKAPIYELLGISSFAFIVLSLLLPETLGETILIRRAERLRKLTGNQLLRTQAELNEIPGETVAHLAWHNFSKAIKLNMELPVFFSNLYIGLVYSIFYLWFEAFPLVFGPGGVYNFNEGEAGLPFLGFVVSGIITFAAYIAYQRYHLEPRYAKNPDLAPEVRFELAIVAGLTIPIALLMFGWGARTNVHWIVPIIGASLYLPGIFLNFQSILLYLASAWPQHASSLFAGNDLFRSSMASVFPLFGRFLFLRLGLGGGSSLLAGLSLIMIPFLYLLMKHGGELRAKSKWSQ